MLNLCLLHWLLSNAGPDILRHAHVGGERGMWNPFGACARGGFLHHAVDLLEGQALGLGNEKVGID